MAQGDARPHRAALVVATGQYEDVALRRLRAPVEDAEALADVLADPEIGGFDVRSVVDYRSHEVLEEIEGFFADRRKDDLLVLYLSCHGVKDDSGRLYFAARNTKLQRLAATGVSSRFVSEQMDHTRSRRVVLLLDCCYAGAFAKLLTKSDKRIDVTERFEGHGRVVMTASSAMEYAWVGDKLAVEDAAGSVFTTALVSGLRTGEADADRDGRITVDELYDYVYDRVREETPKQTPGILTALHGELVIAQRAPARDTAPQAPPEAPPKALRPGPRPKPPRPPRRRWAAIAALAAVVLAVLGVTVAKIVNPPIVNPPSSSLEWRRVADLGLRLEVPGVAAVNGKVWAVGGLSAEGERPALRDVRVYDPAAGAWTAGPALPLPIDHAAVTTDGTSLFIVGGRTGSGVSRRIVRDVYRLDPRDGTWQPLPTLPQPRAAGAAAWDGRRLVFAGGFSTTDDQTTHADVWALQGTRWQKLGDLQRRSQHLAAVSDGAGTVWFIGGYVDEDRDTPHGLIDVVRGDSIAPGKNVTPVQAPAAVWRADVGVCLLGGRREKALTADVTCDRTAADRRWPALPVAVAGAGAALLGDTVFVVGGFTSKETGTEVVHVLDLGTGR
jgi:N-acetylneuraminic acid mutarotase